MQDRTQLADTPGSKYTQDCLSLVSEARYGELLSRWLGQIELLLAKAQDKGVHVPPLQHQIRDVNDLMTGEWHKCLHEDLVSLSAS